MKPLELAGKIFGRLRVIEKAHVDKNCHLYWLCLCSCGNYKVAAGTHLIRSLIRSCGCLHMDAAKASCLKHGHNKRTGPTAEYRTWTNIKTRCENPRATKWEYWGGRGITVCREWSESFEAFYRDMGPRPKGTSIDRINNDGNYEPGNCRWATPKEQRANRRR